jgi:predicted PurR-regulated permease PerM
MDPLVKFIRRPFKERNIEHLMPRSLAIVVAYLFVFTIFGIGIANLAPLIGIQAREFADNLPNYATSIQEGITSLDNRFDQLMISEEVQKQINNRISESFQFLTGIVVTGFLSGFALNLVTYLPWLLLIPILGFLFLKDVNLFKSLFLRCFPSGRWRARADSVLTDVNTTLAGYTQAQIISSFIIGTVTTIVFYILGLDYALLLGILAAIFEFVPLLGPLTIGTTAILVGAFSDNPWRALYVAVFLIIFRFTHDYVTYPRIVREGIHLHPLAVILSILAGEQIAGIPGVFISIPIVAILTVFYKHILDHMGKTGFFADLLEPQKPNTEPKETS